MNTNNTILKAKIVKQLVAENYEPGRLDRCRLWVYRTIVRKRIPMSERTFFRLLHMDTEAAQPRERQLSLFD